MSANNNHAETRRILNIVDDRSLTEQERRKRLERELTAQNSQNNNTVAELQTKLQAQYLEVVRVQTLEAEKQKESAKQQENTKKLNENKFKLQMLWNAVIIAVVLKLIRIRNKRISRKKALRIALATAYLKRRRARIAALNREKVRFKEKGDYAEKRSASKTAVFFIPKSEKMQAFEPQTQEFIANSALSTSEDVFSLTDSLFSVLGNLIPKETLDSLNNKMHDFREKLAKALVELDTKNFDTEEHPEKAMKDFIEKHITNPLEDIFHTAKKSLDKAEHAALDVVKECQAQATASLLSWFQGQTPTDPELRAKQASENSTNWTNMLANAPAQMAETESSPSLRDKIAEVVDQYPKPQEEQSKPLVFQRQKMGATEAKAEAEAPKETPRKKHPPKPNPYNTNNT